MIYRSPVVPDFPGMGRMRLGWLKLVRPGYLVAGGAVMPLFEVLQFTSKTFQPEQPAW